MIMMMMIMMVMMMMIMIMMMMIMIMTMMMTIMIILYGQKCFSLIAVRFCTLLYSNVTDAARQMQPLRHRLRSRARNSLARSLSLSLSLSLWGGLSVCTHVTHTLRAICMYNLYV